MNPVIRKKSAFKVAGYGINTNISENFTKDIAAYWDTYNGENLECKMYKQLNPPKHGEVGICVPCSENGNAVYLLGVLSIVVKETWRYIFDKWFPYSDYEFDETKMDFEFYNERCHGTEDAVMEIYVPITRKSV